MRLSIFTPTHSTKFLQSVYDSIKDQLFDEWVILYNNGAIPIDFKDNRVKSVVKFMKFDNVGIYKRMACDSCSGDIIVELDHDDLLMPEAISKVKEAFEDPEVGFAYSDAIRCNMNYVAAPRFNNQHGWKYATTEVEGKRIEYPISFEATPASVSRIWYAPDHVRAYRKSVYDKVGGHDPNLKVLDDQDLMCRMYLETKFKYIPEPLYIYRVHGENTWLTYNKEIQQGVYPLYEKYIESLAIKWTGDQGLICLDLGGRLNGDHRYISVDLKDADITADLNEPWKFRDSSVGVIRAYDIFEHLKDPIFTIKELSRVLAPGGYAFIQVPSTDGRGAFQDPTHVSYWNENSFLYYTNSEWAKYIDTPVRFQPMLLHTTPYNEDRVCWTRAHLVNLKDGYKPPGIVSIQMFKLFN